jgi:hypothetical protein
MTGRLRPSRPRDCPRPSPSRLWSCARCGLLDSSRGLAGDDDSPDGRRCGAQVSNRHLCPPLFRPHFLHVLPPLSHSALQGGLPPRASAQAMLHVRSIVQFKYSTMTSRIWPAKRDSSPFAGLAIRAIRMYRRKGPHILSRPLPIKTHMTDRAGV